MVWICYEMSYDGCNIGRDLAHVFDCELKAARWVKEGISDDFGWREYRAAEVE